MADKENAEESTVENASEQTDETPKTYSEQDMEEAAEAARKTEFDKNNDQLSRVGAENKSLRLQLEQPRTTDPKLVNKLVDLVEAGRDTEGSPEKLQTMSQQLREEATRIDQQSAWETRVAQEKNKVIQKIEAANANPDDEKFDTVWDKFEQIAWTSGKFETVDSRLDRVLSKSKPAKETKEKKESPLDLDNLSKEQKEEIERKVMDWRGETKDDTGGPAGGMDDERWIKEVYNLGNSDDHTRAQKYLDKLK